MCQLCDYTIHAAHHHYGWDNSQEPVERVTPGQTVEFTCIDASAGQITRTSTVYDLMARDASKVNPGDRPHLY